MAIVAKCSVKWEGKFWHSAWAIAKGALDSASGITERLIVLFQILYAMAISWENESDKQMMIERLLERVSENGDLNYLIDRWIDITLDALRGSFAEKEVEDVTCLPGCPSYNGSAVAAWLECQAAGDSLLEARVAALVTVWRLGIGDSGPYAGRDYTIFTAALNEASRRAHDGEPEARQLMEDSLMPMMQVLARASMKNEAVSVINPLAIKAAFAA